jgi:hypothetical protein
MTIQDYLNLITSAWQDKPNFISMVSQNVSILVQIQDVLSEMIPLFDLDLPPVGNQLDILGQWVGITRNVNIPIAGIYFTWNDTVADGWDYGTWQPYTQPTTITQLPDDSYLTLIRAKIAANYWNGTIDGAYLIWDTVFPNFKVIIQDYQNMTYAMALVGGIVDSLTLALLLGGYLPLRPEGVEIVEYFTATDNNPAFAWDIVNPSIYLAGWNTGSWLAEHFPS